MLQELAKKYRIVARRARNTITSIPYKSVPAGLSGAHFQGPGHAESRRLPIATAELDTPNPCCLEGACLMLACLVHVVRRPFLLFFMAISTRLHFFYILIVDYSCTVSHTSPRTATSHRQLAPPPCTMELMELMELSWGPAPDRNGDVLGRLGRLGGTIPLNSIKFHWHRDPNEPHEHDHEHEHERPLPGSPSPHMRRVQ